MADKKGGQLSTLSGENVCVFVCVCTRTHTLTRAHSTKFMKDHLFKRCCIAVVFVDTLAALSYFTKNAKLSHNAGLHHTVLDIYFINCNPDLVAMSLSNSMISLYLHI